MRLRCAYLVLVAALVLCAASPGRAGADDLPRRGALGAAITAKDGGVAVLSVVPNSAAERAGLLAGDAIVSIDDAPVTTVADFLAKLRRPAGSAVTLAFTRSGMPMRKSIVLSRAAEEHDPNVDTIYGDVTVDGTLRRTLLTVPHGSAGRHPAVLIVGGTGCFSVDVASAPDSYRSLAFDLGRRGIVALRLEKSGVGDSQGPPCSTVDFLAESRGYDVALAALRANPAVDRNRIYLFGHSIGSFIAPRIAAHERVAGVIMAEGVGRNWVEYELINLRRQLALGGEAPRETWLRMQRKEFCMHRLLIEKQSAESLVAERADCKESIQYPAPATYLQQVSDLNIAELWTKVEAPVLVIYGRADFITDEADHRSIAGIVNGAHPGHATLTIIDDMDHYLNTAASQAQSYEFVQKQTPGPYNPAFSRAVLGWLCGRDRCNG